jgi:hypothetical protein
MLVHAVYFWLREDLNDVERDTFMQAVRTLKGIAEVQAAYIGGPAGTERRPVIDASYSCALVLVFADVAAQDRYQTDPIHLAFVERCRSFWKRVQIYDSEG